MDLINKRTKKPDRSVNENERDAIIQYVMGESSSDSGVNIQELLRGLYEDEQWVKCDCHPSTPSGAGQSVEHLKENDSGLLYFVRNSSSPLHAESCAFYSDSRSAPAVSTKRTVMKSCVLNFHSEIHSEETNVAANPSEGSRTKSDGVSQRRSSLGSLMLNLMNDASLNRLKTHDQKVYVFDLTAATQRFEVTQGICLNDVFTPSLTAESWLDEKLAGMAQNWPKKSRPYGMMAGVVDTLNQLVYLGNKTSLGHHKTVGPHLVLATYTNKTSEPDSLEFHRMRIVTIPVAEKFWPMPVESNLEREVAIKLKQVMRHVHKEYKVELSLEKPLLDTETPEGSVRCDFVLTDNKNPKTLAIEVMGFDDDDYRDRKDRQIPIMRTLYNSLIEVDMSGNEEQKKKMLKKMSIEIQKFFC